MDAQEGRSSTQGGRRSRRISDYFDPLKNQGEEPWNDFPLWSWILAAVAAIGYWLLESRHRSKRDQYED